MYFSCCFKHGEMQENIQVDPIKIAKKRIMKSHLPPSSFLLLAWLDDGVGSASNSTTMATHYETLGVDKSASEAEIKSAYRKCKPIFFQLSPVS